MKNKSMQEMNEQFRDCPFQVNDYEIDGRIYHVTSHFVSDKDVNEVIRQYAENKAISEILGQFAENMTA